MHATKAVAKLKYEKKYEGQLPVGFIVGRHCTGVTEVNGLESSPSLNFYFSGFNFTSLTSS